MSRTYLVFGSNDGENYKKLGVVDAATHHDAQTQARELGDFSEYGSITQYHWRARRPRDRTVTDWENVSDDQMTIEDALQPAAVAEVEKAISDHIAESKELLEGPKSEKDKG